MHKLSFYLALSLATISLAGCTTVSSPNTRTVLLTLDGASDEYVDALLADDQLDQIGIFKQSQKKGYQARELTPINVASTGPSHVAIFSGASPSKSGAVGQTFAVPNIELPQGSDAFAYVSSAETIVAAARRQGKRTACLAAPGFDGRTENYVCDYMLNFVQSSQESVVIKLAPIAGGLADARRSSDSENLTWLVPQPNQNSLPKIITEGLIGFALQSRHGDGNKGFNTLMVRSEDGRINELAADRIFPLHRIENGKPVTNALWLNSMDPVTGEVEVYWGQPYYTDANSNMATVVVSKLGPWPGTLDARGLHAGRISEAGFDALNEYQAQYALDALDLLLKHSDWDLLLGYLPYLDTVQHKYLVSSTLQLDHDTKTELYSEKVKRAYLLLDRGIGEIADKTYSKNTNFVVASDHGMVPTHSAVAISSLIESWGYAVGGRRPDIGIFTSGASAHIYINSDDRLGGHISRQRKLEILQDLQNRLRELKDNSNSSIFAFVGTRETLSELAIDHDANTGDLFISTVAGFSLDSRKSPTQRYIFPLSFDRQTLTKSGLSQAEVDHVAGGFLNQGSPGVHGHIAGTPGIGAILYGKGPDIGKVLNGAAHMLQLAPSIACLLEISAPASALSNPATGFCKSVKK